MASFLKNVDLDDGAKIIGHLLGNGDSVKTIAKESGVSSKETSNILSAAAPLLMSLLGQGTSSKKNNNTAAALSIASAVLQNVDVGDLLGNLLGGGSTKKKTAAAKKDDDNDSAAEVIGDILGKLLK